MSREYHAAGHDDRCAETPIIYRCRCRIVALPNSSFRNSNGEFPEPQPVIPDPTDGDEDE